jgi:hypothetical protein
MANELRSPAICRKNADVSEEGIAFSFRIEVLVEQKSRKSERTAWPSRIPCCFFTTFVRNMICFNVHFSNCSSDVRRNAFGPCDMSVIWIRSFLCCNCLLEYNDVQSGRCLHTFRRTVLPLSSGSKKKPSKQLAERTKYLGLKFMQNKNGQKCEIFTNCSLLLVISISFSFS